jgi:hypothetical protein
MLILILTAIGVTLIVQPDRYSNTPSYANLLNVLPAWGWGIAYSAVAVLHGCELWFRKQLLTTITHTIGIILVTAWLAAFVVRYITDDGTTIVNVASWSAYLYLELRSLRVASIARRGGTHA